MKYYKYESFLFVYLEIEETSDEDDDEMKKILNNLSLKNSNSSKGNKKEEDERIIRPSRYLLQKTKSFRETDEERKLPNLMQQKSKEN